MLSKPLRSNLCFLVVAGLLLLSSCSAVSQAPASVESKQVGDNITAFQIGSIYAQPVDPNGKLFLSSWLDPDGSDFDQKVWDNFTLQSNETITEIDWFGGYDPLKFGAGGSVVDFTVAIYPSIAAGTEPGVAGPPLLEFQTGGNAGETSIGMVGTIPMYAYAFSLPTAFDASASVKYWVHIVASQQGSIPDWGIAAGTGGDGSHYRWGSGAGGDSGFRSVPGNVAFTLLGPIPDTPTDISLSNTMVDENQPVNTLVGTLTATDPDPNTTFTFSLTCTEAGADDLSFNISGMNLQTSVPFDFETRNIFDICIRATNQGGATFDKYFIITVNDVNEAPISLSLSNSMVDENQPGNTIIGVLTATDPDAGTTFTFHLTCTNTGPDDSSFKILGADLETATAFDFETKPAYNICIRVMDQGGLTSDKNFVVTVNNVNEAPTGMSLSNTNVDENQPDNTVVGTLNATDPDAGSIFIYSLVCSGAGTDNASFNISGPNLQTSAILDFETKSTYDICIRVTDQGGLTFDKNFIVTVNDRPENAAPTDIALSNSTVDENQPINTAVGLLTATDSDTGETFMYSLACATPGVDDAAFNIQASNLQTSVIFDFEAISSYNICIRVTDQGGLTFDKHFVITVNDRAETSAPTDISLSANRVTENQPINTVVGTLTATDPDAGETFTFSLACAGTDNGSFNILGTDLRTSATFDFETKSIYNICIRVRDQGGSSFEESFAVTVKDVFEPTNTPGSVTGGGNIGSDQGKDKITFGFTIQFKKGDALPKGNLTYQDHGTGLRLKATSFELLMFEGNHGWFTGVGVVNDGQLVKFTVEIDELSKLGQPDSFYIHIPELDGYEAGGSLTGGNITIH